jgi:SAM-dependent methyltransferase
VTMRSIRSVAGILECPLPSDGLLAHGPPAAAGRSLPLDLAPRAWWRGRYRSNRIAVWDAVTSLIPEATGPASLAIDIGCGVRPFDRALEARGHRVLGIDVAGQQADVVGSVERLPIASDRASVALSINVLQYVTRPLEACNEIVRALKPGGRFIVCVPAHHPFDHLDLWRWTGFSAALLLEQADLTEVGVATVGTTAGNILHLTALSLRKRIPLAGALVATSLETAAVHANKAADHRLPPGYVAHGTKPRR